MPIELRDAEELAERGYAALLRVLRRGDSQAASFVGAVLLVNACGEPVEFVHNHIGLPATSLCAPDRLPAFAARSLVSTLFRASVYAPLFLAYPEGELDDELFTHRLTVAIPVAAVYATGGQTGVAHGASVCWLNAPPEPGSRASALLEALSNRDLLADALTRAGNALCLMDSRVVDDVVG